ncbi:MAG: RraA family protein [Actinobacteria bacterium]|nr:RraA family protein [Actinomycetota bacterium]
MIETGGFAEIPTTVLADVLGRAQVMDAAIRSLWSPVGRVAGPAFTVQCAPGDNLMLHAAIYRAPPGSVVVVEAGDADYAVAGGNVCAVAQRRGIAAFVVDGVIRDLAEVRDAKFPVFARGLTPVAGVKSAIAPLNKPVRCGGVLVRAGDIVVADDDGVMVVPAERLDQALSDGRAKLKAEAEQTLDMWEAEHHARIERILAEHGFDGNGQLTEAG